MTYMVCPGCSRSIKPEERLEYDKKTKKNWQITYCPNERCGFNIDIVPMNLKTWNDTRGYFEDYLP